MSPNIVTLSGWLKSHSLKPEHINVNIAICAKYVELKAFITLKVSSKTAVRGISYLWHYLVFKLRVTTLALKLGNVNDV